MAFPVSICDWMCIYFQCSEFVPMKWHEFCRIPEMGVTLLSAKQKLSCLRKAGPSRLQTHALKMTNHCLLFRGAGVEAGEVCFCLGMLRIYR